MNALPPVNSIRNLDEIRREAAVADKRRGEFLRALDDSDYNVSDWEAKFLDSFLDFTSNRPSDEPRWWTDGRRAATDRMMSHYPDIATQLGIPAPAVAAGRALIPQAESGACGYLVRGDDRVQRCCGAPAVARLRSGLGLCQEHEDERQRGLAKLRAFKERNLRN